MKSLTVISFSILLFLFSCNRNLIKNKNEINDYVVRQTLKEFQLGFIDNNNKFIILNKNHLTYFFKQLGVFGQTGVIEKYYVMEGISKSNSDKKYVLQVYAVEGKRRISIQQSITDNGENSFKVAGETCTCSSTCTSGCEVNVFIGCSCTTCSDENPSACTKTHTVGKDAIIRKALMEAVKLD